MKKHLWQVVGLLALLVFFGFSTEAKAEVVASGTCGENLTWELDDEGTLTISGSGEIAAFTYPWDSFASEIKELIIGEGITGIGNNAFFGCSSLSSIYIPNSVTAIGEEAFCGCTSLTEIILPNSITEIGEGTFIECSNLKTIVLPNSITTVPGRIFVRCTQLSDIVIPDGVTSIGYNAFAECSGLTGIAIPDTRGHSLSLHIYTDDRSSKKVVAC